MAKSNRTNPDPKGFFESDVPGVGGTPFTPEVVNVTPVETPVAHEQTINEPQPVSAPSPDEGIAFVSDVNPAANPKLKDLNKVQETLSAVAEKAVNIESIIGGGMLSPTYSSKVENFFGGARIVRLKRIPPFKFRLNLEKQPENYMMFPGSRYRWEPQRIGQEYVTGLENLPEVREKLERHLRVSLAPDSDFYANLSFNLEDRPKGQIMNLEDPNVGYFYQVLLYAMVSSPLIASSYEDYHTGKKPKAEWYLENKEREMLAEAEFIEKEQSAFELFSELSLTRRQMYATILGLEVIGLSPKAAGTALWNFLKKGEGNLKSSQAIEMFLRLNKQNDDYLVTANIVARALKSGVMRRNSNRELEFRRQPVGQSEDAAISMLMNPTNRMMLLEIQKETDTKLGE